MTDKTVDPRFLFTTYKLSRIWNTHKKFIYESVGYEVWRQQDGILDFSLYLLFLDASIT